MTVKRFAFPIFLAGAAILSAGALFVRLADVGAVQSAFWRVAISSPMLLVLAWLSPGTAMTRRSSGLTRSAWLVGAGLLFAVDLATWHLGIKRTTLANAALLANGASFFFPIYGYAAARRWPTRQAASALVLALAGAVLLMGLSARLSTRHLAGDLLCVTAALSYTVYLAIMDKARAEMAVWPVLAMSSLLSAMALLPIALLSNGAFWPHDWTPVVCLAVGSQVLGQGLTVMALPYLKPLAIGLGLLIQPILTTLIGITLFGERLGPFEMLGMAMILVALVLVRLPGRGRAPTMPPQE